MLVKNTNKEPCKHSMLGDGNCCCNCKYLHILYVGNIPMRYICKPDEMEGQALTVRNKLHGDLCEMHSSNDGLIIEE